MTPQQPLPKLCEPFASFPSLLRIALPNASREVPGVTFSIDARYAGAQAGADADLSAPTLPFPYPCPLRCATRTTLRYQPGSPPYNLASAYWSYGYCEGMLKLIESYPECPDGQAAREGVWASRFPNPEFAQWAPYMGGIPPRAWDLLAVRAATAAGTLYKVPKWAEWFAQYRKNNFQAPTCYWKHA